MTPTPSNDLTPLQLRLLSGLAEGKCPKQIAAELGMARGTVSWYLHKAYGKMGASHAAHAVSLAIKANLI